jgi:alpha-D-xyloside xylohydrolase
MARTPINQGSYTTQQDKRMKFSDGYWRIREGYRPAYPTEAYDIATTDETLTVYAPTRPIEHRGHTLGGPLLTVTFSSPMADVIGVRLSHFEGQQARPPQFALNTDEDVAPAVTSDDGFASLSSGSLCVRVSRANGWQLEFVADDRVLTSSPQKGMAIIESDAGDHYIREQLTLGVGEYVYGLGERFGPFVKNGQSVDVWNEDAGTSSEQAYKNVPFYLTNRGYGVFVNNPGPVSFEVASEMVTRVQFSIAEQALEYFVIYGPSPREILRKYTALTGRPALPPAWSFGLWLSTSFTTSYDEATVSEFVDGMERHGLPLSVFHFDSFWMREFNWCDFEWNPRTFPDPRGMLERLRARGLRISVWINPYIAQRSPLFAEGKANGYLLRKPNGDVWQWDRWQPGMGLVDFTNPAARAWYRAKLENLMDMGVDCFKTDFGERVPTDVAWFDGADPMRMHNYYTSLYNQTVFDMLEERRGTGDAVVFARSATAGTQRFPVHWGGDSSATYESMAESLRAGLSIGLSGFGFWSHDIGGFEGTPSASVFKRWAAFGMLSSHSRLHGNESYRVPWSFDDESVDVMRRFTRLKNQLMPYLYQASVEAHELGAPVMRAMVLEFPHDPACSYLDRQYMLGESLLVAPVFSDAGTIAYYVPSGTWTHLTTGQTVAGPGWQTETHGYDSLPLLVRPNSVIAFGDRDERPDYDFRDGVTLVAYELDDGGRLTTTVPGPSSTDPSRFEFERDGRSVRVVPVGAAGPWRVILANQTAVASVGGGSSDRDPRGVVVTPDSPSTTLHIELASD